ncbi:MAG TPA: hypothetical protein P5567_02495 [Kiritimatiellia bacterium]|nr:hypothetical protein [Kiritimatiellia bacterium]HRZ11301.1 hypothetical protein [Kiritimatiellia bacterium]HSA17148.1 hypothetical protein [Kiritimatiellia bacterium]
MKARLTNKRRFSLTRRDAELFRLARRADHRTLAIWARDCAKRVMPYFESARPADPRPRQALEALQAWIDTGQFKMAVIRKASLSSHAAARAVGEDNAARSAARAAGQAVATAHVQTHAPGAALYAQQARHRAADPAEADAAAASERDWQLAHLRKRMGKE